MKTIVISVEGLSTGLFGAYGSSLAKTPTWDRLATTGILLDQCYVDSLGLPTQLGSLWTAGHAAGRDMDSSPTDASVWQIAKEAGVRARLFTDSQTAADIGEALGCADVSLLPAQAVTKPAESIDDCALMQLFAFVAEVLAAESGQPAAQGEADHGNAGQGDAAGELIWIHSSGLRLAWDAPLALRETFIDPEDPSPPDEVGPPCIEVTPDTDPDLIVGWGQVAAAQAAVFDEALTLLIASQETVGQWDNCDWIICGLGGLASGVGKCLGMPPVTQLRQEQLACPVLMRLRQLASGSQNIPGIGIRRPELFQLPDIAATLSGMLRRSPGTGKTDPDSASEWGVDIRSLGWPECPSRWPSELRAALIDDVDQRWIRTPAWSLRLENEDSAALFVKPDDLWEVSDVADRRPDIVVQLRAVGEQFLECLQKRRRGTVDEMSDELLELLR